MTTRAIVPVKLSLTEGDFYTLWAPTWREKGSEWQAFMGDDQSVLVFHSPEELLAYVSSTDTHDLVDHPQWEQFQSCLLYTSPSPRDGLLSRMPSSA